jgi:hypothetical protein
MACAPSSPQVKESVLRAMTTIARDSREATVALLSCVVFLSHMDAAERGGSEAQRGSWRLHEAGVTLQVGAVGACGTATLFGTRGRGHLDAAQFDRARVGTSRASRIHIR